MQAVSKSQRPTKRPGQKSTKLSRGRFGFSFGGKLFRRCKTPAMAQALSAAQHQFSVDIRALIARKSCEQQAFYKTLQRHTTLKQLTLRCDDFTGIDFTPLLQAIENKLNLRCYLQYTYNRQVQSSLIHPSLKKFLRAKPGFKDFKAAFEKICQLHIQHRKQLKRQFLVNYYQSVLEPLATVKHGKLALEVLQALPTAQLAGPKQAYRYNLGDIITCRRIAVDNMHYPAASMPTEIEFNRMHTIPIDEEQNSRRSATPQPVALHTVRIKQSTAKTNEFMPNFERRPTLKL